MSVLMACMYVHSVLTGYLWRQERDIRCTGTKFTSMWVLGTETESCAKVALTLSCEPLL